MQPGDVIFPGTLDLVVIKVDGDRVYYDSEKYRGETSAATLAAAGVPVASANSATQSA